MIEIKAGTIEERIIKTLQNKYPITLKELSKELGISQEKLKVELIKLQSKKILVLEPLPDKIFIRLIRFDFVFVGRRTQYKFIKKKKDKRKDKKDKDKDKKEDDIMYL